MNKYYQIPLYLITGIIVLASLFILWVYLSTYHPKQTEPAHLSCPSHTPLYSTKKPLSVLSYNVQYFAGKNYIFYYDLPDNQGKDTRPTRLDIDTTLDGIAKLIEQQNADIVLLQEVHEGAEATDKRNQRQELLARLPKDLYPCYSETFYWQANFVPHPKIMGSVGMKLVTLSKYKLQHPIRHRLAQPPKNWLVSQFSLKRAVLETELAQPPELPPIKILNTHFDAFAQGSNTMEKQVSAAKQLFKKFDDNRTPWILGGDLNLLLPQQFKKLKASQQYLYKPETELVALLDWPHIPNLKLLEDEPQRWLTHLPNDSDIDKPDRVIDYLFYSSLWQQKAAEVLNQNEARTLSDHFPVKATFSLSKF